MGQCVVLKNKVCVLYTARCFCTAVWVHLIWEHLPKWEYRKFCSWMLFLEVSGLDPALLSVITGRQEVLQHVGEDGGVTMGAPWDLAGA